MNQDEQANTGLAQALLGVPPPQSGLGAGLMQGASPEDGNSSGNLPALRDMLLAMQDPDLQTTSAGLPWVAPVHVPTGAPAAAAQSLPVAAVMPGRPSPSRGDDQAALSEFIESRRPDLGSEGDAMRGVLRSGFTRDMFDNYWQGGGQGVQLSGPRFKDIADHASTLTPTPNSVRWIVGPDSQILERRTYDFGGVPDYNRSLGSSMLFYDPTGKPVGFYDNYNFDPSHGKRTPLAELETRVMHELGPLQGAKAFPIYYGEYAPPIK